MGLIDSVVAQRLWTAAKEMVHAFMQPSLGWDVPADIQVGILVFGIFLVVAGAAFAVQGRGKFVRMTAIAAAVAVAGWVLFGGMDEVATFFVVILLVLKFLGGVTMILGIFRSLWGPAAVLVAVMLAATGVVDPRPLAFALALLASLLGAFSLFKRAEEFSPGRKGTRWNRCTAVGWTACLLAAGMLRSDGLAGYGKDFKVAGMVVGLAILFLLPRTLGRGVKVKLGGK